jgi:hypothetical protein
MAATTIAHVDTLSAQVEQDVTLSAAQKAQVFSHLYSTAVILFGSNAASTNPTSNGGKSGRADGRLGV